MGRREVACWEWVGSRERDGIELGCVVVRMPSYFLRYNTVPRNGNFSPSDCISYIKIWFFLVKFMIRMNLNLKGLVCYFLEY